MPRQLLRAPIRLATPRQAHRRVVRDEPPLEYSVERPASRGLVVGAGVLGLLVLVELAVAVAVIS
jgi:hypothetical protein